MVRGAWGGGEVEKTEKNPYFLPFCFASFYLVEIDETLHSLRSNVTRKFFRVACYRILPQICTASA